MKIILTILTIHFLACSFAFAKHPKKSAQVKKIRTTQTCNRLLRDAKSVCTKNLCRDFSEHTGEPCNQDGDFNEALNECLFSETLPFYIDTYNRTHSKKAISCDDVEFN